METPAIASSAYSSQALNMEDVLRGNANVRRLLMADNVARPQQNQNQGEVEMATVTRIVQVFVADPSDNVPLDSRVIYRGEQKVTDLTDQELFFEIEIKSILDRHNAERVKLINKAIKDRTEHLEPARIRDLKMTVVTIAQF